VAPVEAPGGKPRAERKQKSEVKPKRRTTLAHGPITRISPHPRPDPRRTLAAARAIRENAS